MRIRITFAKLGALRYTGHLDLHKLWERAARRARLDQHDIAHALLDGQVICRGDAGDPGATDHDLGS